LDFVFYCFQVKLSSPELLQLSVSFISRVMMLPYSSLSYSKYLELIKDFGTHYVPESKMGGTYGETNVFSRFMFSLCNRRLLGKGWLMYYLWKWSFS